MVCFPPSKINLGLQVVSRRPEGYHEVITCYYPVPFTDILEIIPSDTFSFTSSGLPIAGATSDNLCVKAYELLRHAHNLPPVAIHLHKIIPMGAGLGGGSSNGAWTLRLLNEIFQIGLEGDDLVRLAGQLGSDCPFFITDRPLLGTGTGTTLTGIDVNLPKELFIVIVKPDIHVATAEAYRMITPAAPSHDLRLALAAPIDSWRDSVRNDFETPVMNKYPVIGQLKQKLLHHGAVYAAMSGSGAAVFGLFRQPVDLQGAFPRCDYFGSAIS